MKFLNVYFAGLLIIGFLSCIDSNTRNEKIAPKPKSPDIQEKQIVNALGFDRMRDAKILYMPYDGSKESASSLRVLDSKLDDFIKSETIEKELVFVPTDTVFRIGKKVWIWPLDLGKLTGKQDEVNFEEISPNTIESIRLVKGKYNYDGYDIALEIKFVREIQNIKGWYLLMDQKVEPKKWSRKRELEYLSLNCKSKIENWNLERVRPLVDLNNDGKPEFYIPYSDSKGGTLTSVCDTKNQIYVPFSNGK